MLFAWLFLTLDVNHLSVLNEELRAILEGYHLRRLVKSLSFLSSDCLFKMI